MGKSYTADNDLDLMDQALNANVFDSTTTWQALKDLVDLNCPELRDRTSKSLRDRVLLLMQKRKEEVQKEEAGSGIEVPERTPLQVALDEALLLKEEADRAVAAKKELRNQATETAAIVYNAAMGARPAVPLEPVAGPAPLPEPAAGTAQATIRPATPTASELPRTEDTVSPLRKRKNSGGSITMEDFFQKRMAMEKEKWEREKELKQMQLEHESKEAARDRELRKEEIRVQQQNLELAMKNQELLQKVMESLLKK